MSERIVLSDVKVELDVDALARELRVPVESADYRDLAVLAREAEGLARPRALYGVAYVEERGDDWVRLDGVTLTSRVLRVNLGDLHRAFVHVATCGTADAWSRELGNSCGLGGGDQAPGAEECQAGPPRGSDGATAQPRPP